MGTTKSQEIPVLFNPCRVGSWKMSVPRATLRSALGYRMYKPFGLFPHRRLFGAIPHERWRFQDTQCVRRPLWGSPDAGYSTLKTGTGGDYFFAIVNSISVSISPAKAPVLRFTLTLYWPGATFWVFHENPQVPPHPNSRSDDATSLPSGPVIVRCGFWGGTYPPFSDIS